MKAVVFSLGCKVNQCEGQSMIALLSARGIEATDVPVAADLYIVNTCSVTAEADRKSRQAVARMRKLNPSAPVYICGCSSQNDPRAFTQKDGVRLVIGTGGKIQWIDDILADYASRETSCRISLAALPSVYEEAPDPRHTKTRGYIKVQDGCNNFCSYCIIPYLRGRSRSRSLDSIWQEAREAAKHTRELVITGINVSAYGPDIGESLVSLVRRLGQLPVRKRIGSLECTAITDELLDAMAENGFCDHFHLSLQSGSDGVLRRMNRKYTTEFFRQRTEKIRSVFPSAGITTDIITGFGGETQHEFAETEQFVRAVRFSDLHVFPYSERKGTRAYAMPQIDKAEREARAASLIAVGEELRTAFCAEAIGRTAEVYAETEEDGETAGYTTNYIRVYSDVPAGACKNVRIQTIYKKGVRGKQV